MQTCERRREIRPRDEKRLILIRHAHRDTTDRGLDNGLSEKGILQADSLLKFYKWRFGKGSAVIVSSPKKRCVETIDPIARALDVTVQTQAHLMEQEKIETQRDFHKRVESFLDWWKLEGPETTLVSSHGDWIPLAISQMVQAHIEVKKGAWIEVERVNGVILLTWALQAIPL